METASSPVRSRGLKPAARVFVKLMKRCTGQLSDRFSRNSSHITGVLGGWNYTVALCDFGRALVLAAFVGLGTDDGDVDLPARLRVEPRVCDERGLRCRSERERSRA